MFKQSLNAFKLKQYPFDSTSIQHCFKGVANGFNIQLFNKIEWMLKQMLKPFARVLTDLFSILHVCLFLFSLHLFTLVCFLTSYLFAFPVFHFSDYFSTFIFAFSFVVGCQLLALE